LDLPAAAAPLLWRPQDSEYLSVGVTMTASSIEERSSEAAYFKVSSQKERPVNRVDHRSQGGPLLEYLWCDDNEPLSGQTLYLGGEVGADGKIWFIPGHGKFLAAEGYGF
jgi:hypothetical protein